MGAGSAGSIGAQQGAQFSSTSFNNDQNASKLVDQANKALESLNQTALQEEGSMSVSKRQLGKNDKKETHEQNRETMLKETTQNQTSSQGVSQASESAASQAEIQRKRKERKKQEDQLLAMQELEGCFEAANLDGQEKQLIDEFFSNLSLLKGLKNKLAFEENRKDHLLNLLDKKNKKRDQTRKQVKETLDGWKIMYRLVCDFKKVNLRFPEVDEIYEDKKLGHWCDLQRQAYHNNTLLKKQIELLARIDFDFNDEG